MRNYAVHAFITRRSTYHKQYVGTLPTRKYDVEHVMYVLLMTRFGTSSGSHWRAARHSTLVSLAGGALTGLKLTALDQPSFTLIK